MKKHAHQHEPKTVKYVVGSTVRYVALAQEVGLLIRFRPLLPILWEKIEMRGPSEGFDTQCVP